MIKKWNNWLGHHPTLRRLQLIALLRSTGQGFAAVETSLYLKELGWSGTAIGALLVAAGLFRTLNTTFAAEWNALLGPKHYLLLHECLTAAAALLLVMSSGSIPLVIAIIAAGFGMGHSGSGGPAAPVERRWLGAFSRKSGSSLFGKHALLSYAGMGTGAVFASLTPLLKPWLPGEEAYRLLFVLPALCAIAGAALLLTIQGGAKRRNTPAGEMFTKEQTASLKTVPHRSGRSSILPTGGIVLLAIFILLAGWKFDLPLLSAIMPVLLFLLLIAAAIVRVSGGSREELAGIMNILQSVAVTLTSTMSAYWFSIRFNAAAGEVGLIIALSYFLAGAMSLVLMQAAERFGPIRPVVYMQLAGAACVLLMPWSPSFGIAAVLYALCSMFNLGTRGSRYAVMSSQQASHKRSWSSRLASLLIRLGAILWPGAFGRMLDEGEHILPFCLAAAIQVFSVSGWRCRTRTKQ